MSRGSGLGVVLQVGAPALTGFMPDASAAQTANRVFAGCDEVPSSQATQAFTPEALRSGGPRRRYTGRWLE
jgi:hypothetical protein